MPEVPWRLAKSLGSKAARKDTGLTVAEGPPSVMALLESAAEFGMLLVSSDFEGSARWSEISGALSRHPKPGEVHTVSPSLYERVSGTKTPQGVLCVLPFPFRYLRPLAPSPWKSRLHVVGADIQDPGNAGTLIRIAASCGATEVAFTGESVDPYSPKCVRSSAGAIFAVPLATCDDTCGFLTRLAGLGTELFLAEPYGGILPWEADFLPDLAIVVGNEAQGIRPGVREVAGKSVTIPMPGRTESINVAMASAMVLYEVLRQRMVGRFS